MSKPHVLVAMSGGVDSSLAAALLLEQGYEVIGAFMKNWSGGVTGSSCADPEKVGEAFTECGWRDERRDAMRVASQLGIPFLTFDFEKEYRDRVIEYLFREYAAGRTPNPDVMCNKFVKFDLFLREADKRGCAFIATGHYARRGIDGSCHDAASPSLLVPRRDFGAIVGVPASCHPSILTGLDPNKDQTYFLWAIPPAILPRVLFPIGHLQKPDVRRMAAERGLVTANKKDSTGICFVGEVDIKAFLKERIDEKPGDIVTTDGNIVGHHDGITFYTIGQRHGLNVGGGMPYYVVRKNVEKNELIVSSAFHPALFKKELTAIQANWFHLPPSDPARELRRWQPTTFRSSARIRYRQPVAPCTVEFVFPNLQTIPPMNQGETSPSIRVTFDEPQRAVTPGQSIVFYDGEEMLGGAIIE